MKVLKKCISCLSANFRFLLLFSFLSVVLNSNAQYYLTGQDPASIRWSELKTEYFRVVFPDNYYQKAQKFAQYLDTSYYACRFDLCSKPLKTDIVLHPHSSISNAVVSWAPYRLDIYPIPPQGSYAQDWFKQLSVHETRHIVQTSRLHHGFGNVLRFVFGQQITAALLGVFVPTWFLEGDAVAVETAMSNSGRGRDALFSVGMRSQLLEKGFYDYDKAYFGSYKDYVPNYYELGYFLVAHNREKYGYFLWENSLKYCAGKAWMLAPFSYGIRETTGMGKNNLYKETMYDLFENWSEQYENSVFSDYEVFKTKNKGYTTYSSPQISSDGSIIAIRSDFDQVSRIVEIKNGTEKVIFTPGSLTDEKLSVSANTVVWSELKQDIRWSNKSFSVVVKGDKNTGKYKYLTQKTQYFAPDISLDGKQIAVLETDIDGNNFLLVINSETGETLLKKNIDSVFLTTPKWHPNGEDIIAVAIGNQGKAFYCFNIENQQFKQLSDFTFTDIHLSDVTETEIIFNASFSEISHIYSFDLQTYKVKQLISVPFGSSGGIFENDTLFFTNYNSSGTRIAKIAKENFMNMEIDFSAKSDFPLADKISKMSIFNIDNVSFSDTVFSVERYCKFKNLFNIHSWAPVFIDADNYEMKPGVSIMSQNSLSTFVAQLGYQFDMNEQTGKTSLDFKYYGLFPEIELGFSTGLRRTIEEIENVNYTIKWWETDWHFNMSVPLNFNNKQYLRGIEPSFSMRQIFRKMDVGSNMFYFKGNPIMALSYTIFAYQQTRKAKRDLQPKYGQSVQITYCHSPFDNDVSEQFFAATRLYFPGFFNNNGINIYAAYQNQKTGFYSFKDLIFMPRGYNDLFLDEATSLKVNYTFPIFYPDLCVPTVFLLQRLRGNLFADCLVSHQDDFSSFGGEIFTDWRFFNLPVPISLGVRISYALQKQELVPEILFELDFDSL